MFLYPVPILYPHGDPSAVAGPHVREGEIGDRLNDILAEVKQLVAASYRINLFPAENDLYEMSQ